ncbi:S1 domain-containing post-transcriptional regulator GSP13 [Lentibacillus halophilus]|uniref:S1 domain-containing post-transcriptional regulator GSP13 n=1 Tax=Lentibacillus halophilus TaxID=295065 RepID=A0ABN0Z2C9_9BACI
MADTFESGQILDGKVTGIQPYGAFIALDDDTQGLVHISEITHGFVKNVNDHLTIGDDVKVKILSIDSENNKFSLSMRAVQDPPNNDANDQNKTESRSSNDHTGFNSLKDKLEEWIKQSETQK